MVKGALWRQKKKMSMIALTVALGVSLATAMLGVMFDVGDKLNKELKSYGANINVIPKGAFLLDDLYGIENGGEDKFLNESELGKIKTIFWAYNIVDLAPYLNVKATLDGQSVRIVGTWFDYSLELPTGSEFATGIRNMKSWWTVEGRWVADNEGCCAMVGAALAEQYGLSVGDSLALNYGGDPVSFSVKGIFDAGGEEDGYIYVTLAAAQTLSGNAGKISSVEVSALTTPDNELSRKASENIKSLSIKEYETWYCTAYVSSIAYQIEEVMTDAVAKPIRRVAESEGAILEKTELLMLLITILSLVGAAVGISNLVTASVMERSKEIGLLKVMGARDSSVLLLILTEILITAVIGGAIGFFAGYGLAQIIGLTVFSSAIALKAAVVPIVIAAVILVTIIGSIPSIKYLLSLRPTEVLHGR
jgi:ABC-type antimicrobial peptide transport system, permease component